MKNIAVFASGSGSNAEKIYKHFEKHQNISINLILTNKKDAFVIERAKKMGVPCFIFNREDFYQSDMIIKKLAKYNTDFIVLAGFLWLIPENLIKEYPGKIINIHPALLPNYGGKGMYGMNVHRAVIENGEKESGITIHFVNEQYDKGSIIRQEKCTISPDDTPETLAAKIHELEYKYFPLVVEELVEKLP